MARHCRHQGHNERAGAQAHRYTLTPREIEILRGLAAGHSLIAIAAGAGVSRAYLRVRLVEVYLKLGVQGLVSAALWAYQHRAWFREPKSKLRPARGCGCRVCTGIRVGKAA